MSVDEYVRAVAPDIGGTRHKGQAGRIGIPEDLWSTGALFRGMSTTSGDLLRLYRRGSRDCSKSYSPEHGECGVLLGKNVIKDGRIVEQEQAPVEDRVTKALPRLQRW